MCIDHPCPSRVCASDADAVCMIVTLHLCDVGGPSVIDSSSPVRSDAPRSHTNKKQTQAKTKQPTNRANEPPQCALRTLRCHCSRSRDGGGRGAHTLRRATAPWRQHFFFVGAHRHRERVARRADGLCTLPLAWLALAHLTQRRAAKQRAGSALEEREAGRAIAEPGARPRARARIRHDAAPRPLSG